jgi:deferrochelatase/peroxidase EfeB
MRFRTQQRPGESESGELSSDAGLSRRELFTGGLAAAAVGIGAGAIGYNMGQQSATAATGLASTFNFDGVHQAGVITPAQDRLHFVAFDLSTQSRPDVVSLLQQWTAAARRMCSGQDAGPYGAVGGNYDAPPDDTGEALGLDPSGLTITFGFGPTFFTLPNGQPRFGLAGQRPPALVDIPHFPADMLEKERSGGDLCIQACANDPQVAVHAIRNLARIAFGTASVRWSQLGFGRTSSTSTTQATPRNLFGYKDGTANVKAEETDIVNQSIWAHFDDGASWMTNGSYLVARRIRMTIETWDRTSLREQDAIIGRDKREGAPLSGGTEFTEPNFAAAGRDNKPLIPIDSHVRNAHPDFNNGAVMLRRGYNFVDGSDSLGRLDAGLFFLAYQRDPRTSFIPIQQNLARNDAMNEYIKHVGSAVFAVPPGTLNSNEYVGQTLFG